MARGPLSLFWWCKHRDGAGGEVKITCADSVINNITYASWKKKMKKKRNVPSNASVYRGMYGR